MNLKEAARELGVHYQTAYKWVRAGELTAVRIGSRYEVSPAAIEQFRAHRRSVVASGTPFDERRRADDIHPEDLLEELEAMAADPVVAIPAITCFVARRVAFALGDTCLVAVEDADGSRHVSIDHGHADRAAFFTALIGMSGGTIFDGSGFLRGQLREREAVVMPIVDQMRMRRLLRPELRQYLDEYPIHSLTGAPIMVAGKVRGAIYQTRSAPGRPYRAEDGELLVRIATRIGLLVQTADELTAAWNLRSDLAATAHRAVTRRPAGTAPTAEELPDVLVGPGSPGAAAALPCIVTTPDDVVIGVNEAFERTYGYSAEQVQGIPRDFYIPPDQIEAERRNIARLVSGEVDYLDYLGLRIDGTGGRLALALHRVAVRAEDATPVCIVAVTRPLHTLDADRVDARVHEESTDAPRA